MHALLGGQWILAVSPVWLLAFVLPLLCVGIIYIGREHYEGFPYNVCYSSSVGDLALGAIVCIQATIVQQHPLMKQFWLGGFYNTSCFVLAVLLGVVWQTNSLRTSPWNPKVTAMDTYHNVFVAPLLLFLLASGAPFLFRASTHKQFSWAMVFLAVWLVALAFDAWTDRLDQRKWLKRHYFEEILRKSGFRAMPLRTSANQ